MTRLTAAEEDQVRRIGALRTSLDQARRDSLRRAKEIVLEEISGHQLALDIEVRRAVEAGIPKARVYTEGLGTKSSRALEDSLARTAKLARIESDRIKMDPLAQRYRWDDEAGVLHVSLDGESVPFKVLSRADFSRYVVTANLDDAQSPVAAWIEREGHEAEALAWFELNDQRGHNA